MCSTHRKQIFKYIFLVSWVSKFQVYIYFLHEHVFYFVLEKYGMVTYCKCLSLTVLQFMIKFTFI